MNDRKFKAEKKKLEETIKQIEQKQIYVDDLIEKKTNLCKSSNSLPGDDIAYRIGRGEQALLKQAKDNPYFGRFDIHTESEGEESFYIGKQTIRDLKDNIVVVDWRRAICSVYYNFTSGKSRQVYMGGKKEQTVNVLEKREYNIKKRRLINFKQEVADKIENQVISERGEDITVADSFLADYISNTETTGYLKEIVATIQKEQDKAIREPINKNLIIQGVAGSGKSSVALHRLSYLIYNNDSIKSDNIMILAPTKMFIHTTKGLLPELDLQGIQQATFYDLFIDHLKPFFHALTRFPSKPSPADYVNKNDSESERKRIKFKSSESFAMVIDMYVVEIEKNYTNRFEKLECLSMNISVEEITKIYHGYNYLSFGNRVEQFMKSIKNRLEGFFELKVKKLEAEYGSVKKFFDDGGLSKEEKIKLAAKLQQVKGYKISEYKKEVHSKWNEVKTMLKLEDPISMYFNLLSKDILEIFQNEIGNEVPMLFKNSKPGTSYYDIAPIYYIFISMYGVKKQFTHMIIDEGQDLSFIHYAVLQKITKTMTILGDIEQSLLVDYGIQNWNTLFPTIFDSIKDSKLELNTSYRSTTEIIEAANTVLSNQFGILHKPITALNRSGPPLSYYQINSGQEMLEKVQEIIKSWGGKYKRIAIIHKEEEKAKKVATYISNSFNIKAVYIDPDIQTENSDISVLSAYNSKGMEFDATILLNVSDENFPEDDHNARLLYVMFTRAHQEVATLYVKRPSKLLDGLITLPTSKKELEYDDIL